MTDDLDRPALDYPLVPVEPAPPASPPSRPALPARWFSTSLTKQAVIGIGLTLAVETARFLLQHRSQPREPARRDEPQLYVRVIQVDTWISYPER